MAQFQSYTCLSDHDVGDPAMAAGRWQVRMKALKHQYVYAQAARRRDTCIDDAIRAGVHFLSHREAALATKGSCPCSWAEQCTCRHMTASTSPGNRCYDFQDACHAPTHMLSDEGR